MRRLLIGWVRILVTPSCWLQNACYSKEWDTKLKQLIAANRFTNIGEHKAFLGGVEIWIDNHPYASFTPRNLGPKVRPRRATILWAHDKLMRDLYTDEVTELEKLYAK